MAITNCPQKLVCKNGAEWWWYLLFLHYAQTYYTHLIGDDGKCAAFKNCGAKFLRHPHHNADEPLPFFRPTCICRYSSNQTMPHKGSQPALSTHNLGHNSKSPCQDSECDDMFQWILANMKAARKQDILSLANIYGSNLTRGCPTT